MGGIGFDKRSKKLSQRFWRNQLRPDLAVLVSVAEDSGIVSAERVAAVALPLILSSLKRRREENLLTTRR
jgi:hypothetical protein